MKLMIFLKWLIIVLFIVPCSVFPLNAAPDLFPSDSNSIVVEGKLQTLFIDEIDAQTKTLTGKKVYRLLSSNGTTVNLIDPRKLLSGIGSGIDDLMISGQLLGNGAVSIHQIVANQDVKVSSEALSEASTTNTLGVQKTLVVLLKFPDKPLPSEWSPLIGMPYGLSDVREIISGSGTTDRQSLSDYLFTVSYGKTWLSVDYVDWVTLPKSLAAYKIENDFLQLILNDTINTVDAMVDLRNYNALMFIYNWTDEDKICAGFGTLGTQSLNSPRFGQFKASWAMGNGPGVMFHEYGHNLKFYHAAGALCLTCPNLPSSLSNLANDCEYMIYGGDQDDIMGGGWNSPPSSKWKAVAGWLDNNQITTVSSPGIYIVEEITQPSGNVKALCIPLGSNNDGYEYWVEYRKKEFSGWDGFHAVDKYGDFLQVRAAPISGDTLRFMSQYSHYSGGHTDPPVFLDATISHPFEDPYRGIKIELVELIGTSQAKVRVTSMAPPSVSVSPASRDVAKDAITTTFNVSNTETLPWTATVTSGGSWLTITSGATGTDAGTITCAFEANTDTARTGTIRVTGPCSTQDVTVTQAGSIISTLLWDCSDGSALIWTMDSGNSTGNALYINYTDGTAKSYRRNIDGKAKMLWANTDGTASLWTVDTSGNPTSKMKYGPYTDWTATYYHENSDGTAQMLWVRADGYTSLWTLDASGNKTSEISYGPYTDWTAKSYHRNNDGTANMLWVRTDGYVSLWNMDTSGNPISKMKYGPYEGWTAKSYYRNSNGTGRMLWVRTDGYVSLWNMDTSGNPISKMKYGPFPGMTAQDYD
ncbi:MAG: BACON domain-containing carbohydrate-binding protein [Pseudomonadota bacterium]